MVVRIPRHIGLVIAIFFPSEEQSLSRPVGLMTYSALPSSRVTARKASWMRKIFPWTNPIARSLLQVGSPGLGHISKIDLKTEVYLLDDWGAAKYGVSK